MDFFPDESDPPEPEEVEEPPQSVWAGAPEDVLPGVVPVELMLGRSNIGVVMLTGVHAFPVGLAFWLRVRIRGRVGFRGLLVVPRVVVEPRVRLVVAVESVAGVRTLRRGRGPRARWPVGGSRPDVVLG